MAAKAVKTDKKMGLTTASTLAIRAADYATASHFYKATAIQTITQVKANLEALTENADATIIFTGRA